MGSAEGNYVSLTRLNPLDELRDQWIKGNERVYIHTTPFEFQKSFFFFDKDPDRELSSHNGEQGVRVKIPVID